jgi:hypothetical protein
MATDLAPGCLKKKQPLLFMGLPKEWGIRKLFLYTNHSNDTDYWRSCAATVVTLTLSVINQLIRCI